MLALVLLGTTALPQGSAAQPPSVGGCPVFPADHVWNTPIDTLPVDGQSSAYVSTIGGGLPLKADFGSGLWDGGPIGIPFITVTGSQQKYPVTFGYAPESDPGPYAIPLNAPIEGGSQSSGDRHTLAIDTTNCILYELFAAYPGSNSWSAGSGAIYDLEGYALRPDTWTSADAAGLPIFPGLVRYDEIVAGEITHAIRFTVPETRNSYVWPAKHEASDLTGAQYPPMGQRFRLKANFDISGYSPANQIILRALKKYGMILADNGSSWYMSGAPDSRWDNDDLHALAGVKGSNFEAIDESSLMIQSNSGKARQPGNYGVSWGTNQTPGSMSTGATTNVSVSFTNLGALTWNHTGANRVQLSYHWRNGACNGSSVAVWDGLRTPLPDDVAQGASVANLPAQVRAPAGPGAYCLQFDLVREGITWFSSQGAAMLSRTVNVSTPVYGVAWTSQNTPGSMAAGSLQAVKLSFANIGSLTWTSTGSNPVRLSYHWFDGACPGTTVAAWDGVRTALPASVPNGSSVANLDVSVRAPAAPGSYCLAYDLVREGITWFSTQGAQKLIRTVVVSTPQWGVIWNSQSTPSAMIAGQTEDVSLSFTNSGSAAWNAAGPNPVHISYHWRTGSCPGTGPAVWDGLRSVLTTDVAPAGSVSGLTASVRAPAAPGTYCLEYDIVKEGVTWFSTAGSPKLTRTVTVN